MDDDQFQGNLNVQGGNPEPETPEQAPVESESEMSRRMNEILGSFDDGIATADAISNGNGQVVQGTAIRAEAPRPDFAQQSAAAPVQADVTMATEGAYDPSTGVQAGMQQSSYDESSFESTPGATPVMTGTPRSSIEQAAAEEAAREAVAAAERKRISPKVIIGIIIAIVLIAAAVVVVAVMMNGGKKEEKKDNNQSQVEPEPEPEPVVEMQRIGTADHGYVTVPKEWTRSLDASVTNGGGFGYSDADMNNVVIINSAAISATMTANLFANRQLNYAIADKMSQPQMITETHGSYSMIKVFFYNAETKKWTFKYVFEAEDGRVHYIQVITTDNTSDLVNSVPNSWSVNQNSEGGTAKKEEEKKEDKTAIDTDENSDETKEQETTDTKTEEE